MGWLGLFYESIKDVPLEANDSNSRICSGEMVCSVDGCDSRFSGRMSMGEGWLIAEGMETRTNKTVDISVK
jgi:hypothetical protein